MFIRSNYFRLTLLLLLLSSTPLVAQPKKADPSQLTLERIFKGNDLSEASPGSVQWSKRSASYFTREPSEAVKGAKDIVRVDIESGKSQVLVSASHLVPTGDSSSIKVERFELSPNEGQVLLFTDSKRVWRQNTRGNYWVFDIASRELTKLGGDAAPSSLMFATFSPDSRKVAYVIDGNIFVEDLGSHKIKQLTKKANEYIINGTFDWVYEEEFGLRNGFRWSPDSKMIAFWQLDTKGVGDYYMVNNTDGVYQKLTKFAYPKAGTTNSACRIGVVSVEKAEPTIIDFVDDPRNQYIAFLDWIPESDQLIIQNLNRLQNTNKVYIMDATVPLGIGGENVKFVKPSSHFTDKDDAWVEVVDELHWINDNKSFLWLSDRDGWYHLYSVDVKSGTPKLITPGDFDVIELLGVDEKDGFAYFSASPYDATQKYLYRAKLDGGQVERVTPKDRIGFNNYKISPDGKYAIHTWSKFNQPPVTTLIRLPDHKVIRPLEDNAELKEDLGKLKLGDVEFFQVDIGDVKLDAWEMRPPNMDPKKQYPLLVYVYGEPAGQTVLDNWSRMRFLWHSMLTQQGYVVMSIDNRGTPGPRGREFRKFVYRKIGIEAPKDQAAAVKKILKMKPYIDPDRIGVWGWSGGGTMSLHALFRYPDLYKMAMSIAPVSNERYYDTIYQERYMGLPQDNVKGYHKGSPLTYAKNLKGDLLIVHGTADDNVHYANTEAIVNELIAANKQFTMMAYPNRTHSIREGRNTRLHLFTLLTRYLHDHLPTD